jgi:AcrR family transcriptional regulator
VVDALGAPDTTLAHHFGTKDQILAVILGRLRERMLAITSKMAGERPDLAAARAVSALAPAGAGLERAGTQPGNSRRMRPLPLRQWLKQCIRNQQ